MNKLQEAWQAEVLAFENSGKSQTTYAKELGVSWSKLNYWIRKFGKNGAVAKLKEEQFVELKTESSSPAKLIQEQSLEIKLTLPGGVILRMRGA